MQVVLTIVQNVQVQRILIARNAQTIGSYNQENVNHYQTSSSWNNHSLKINSQESMVGFLLVTRQEDKSMNVEVNQW